MEFTHYIKASYIETSAKDGTNIEALFDRVLDTVMQKDAVVAPEQYAPMYIKLEPYKKQRCSGGTCFNAPNQR